jgi:hypothetical protein
MTMGMVEVAFWAARTPGVPWVDDHIDLETNQVRKQRRKPIIVAIRPAVLDDKIPSLLIAEIAQARAKSLGAFGQTVSSGQTQKPDAKDLRRRLLRPRRDRPRHRCTDD